MTHHQARKGGKDHVDFMQVATKVAQPRRGTVRDRWGDLCFSGTADSYPLLARCDHCDANIVCKDGSAEWYHRLSLRAMCDKSRSEANRA